MSTIIDDNGTIQAVIDKLSAFPDKLREVLGATMEAANLAVWESTPGYPDKPEGSKYDRTGTLGRTLGVDESGAKGGQPDIFEVREMSTGFEAHFGTNLGYAPYVIGESQAWMHKGIWWTMADIAEKATPKVRAIFERVKDEVVAWFNRGA